MDPYSLYLHIPFCRHRCGYCDFNTYAGQESLIPAYVAALRHEAELVSRQTLRAGRLPVHTIFFGGGTPSLLPIDLLAGVLSTLHNGYDLQPDLEVTLEANPGTLSAEGLAGLRRMGVNRLSLGVQSAHPDDLRLLQRRHDYPDVIRSVYQARRAGFDNISLDLIFGIPGQSLARWQHTLELVLGLQVEHLSLYALTIEADTPFGRWAGRGLLSLPDDDLAADMYEYARDRLSTAGYRQYEISNWALPERRCRHNLQYWRNRPYLGFGAGAHGYAAGYRLANVPGIGAYIQQVHNATTQLFPFSPANTSRLSINRQAEIQETMMVGLRLTEEGVSAAGFASRFGQSLESVYHDEIETLLRRGLLEWGPEQRLRLTHRGCLLGNRVFAYFVGDGD